MGRNHEIIAIYSRKSKFTGKGESIGKQVELCKEYVRNMFGEADADRCVVFEDEGFSGGNLKRPDFQRMMEEVRKRKFKAIIVYRLDRISRNISDFTGLIDELNKLEVSFVSIREQFGTSTPMGRAMMFIIPVFSQLEWETIAERIRDNMHELAKTGRWLGGNTPTGFKSGAVSKVTIDGKERKSYKLIPLPEEIEIPRMIFDLYTETDSLTAVEAELLRQRIKTKQGKDFTRFAIKAILQNPVYMVADKDAYHYFTQKEAEVCSPKEAFDGSCGIMAYNRTNQEKGRATQLLPVSQWIVAIGKHPGVVPSKQWIHVQESLERNKSKAYRKPRNNEALLTGLLYCVCGERIVQRNERRLAQPLLASNDQAAVFQLPEDPRGALAAAVELGLRLFQGEVQPDGAVRLDVAVLPGNAGSVQQQRIEYLGVVADVTESFVLKQEPWKRHIGRCRTLRRELAKSFHLTSCPIHQSIHFCVD